MNNYRLIRKLQGMSQQELYDALYTDALTGVQNRRAFEAEHEWTHVAIVDMDSLKYLNDTSGHRTGDKFLKNLAGNLAQVFGENNVYRLSGDEFAVVNRCLCPWELTEGMEHLHTYIPEFSYGMGKTLDTADEALRTDKAERELAGLRAPRGERPPWLV